MITIQEVRVGNIFYWQRDTGEKLITVRIEDLLNREFIENAVPVTISADMLLKMGFIKREELRYSKTLDRLENTQKSIRTITLQYFNDWAFYDDDHLLTHVKYLHELQNLYFALTRQELNH